MEEFVKHFNLTSTGSWECISFAEIDGPNGRIQVTPGSRFTRGTSFMGVDLAEWLEEEYKKGKPRSVR